MQATRWKHPLLSHLLHSLNAACLFGASVYRLYECSVCIHTTVHRRASQPNDGPAMHTHFVLAQPAAPTLPMEPWLSSVSLVRRRANQQSSGAQDVVPLSLSLYIYLHSYTAQGSSSPSYNFRDGTDGHKKKLGGSVWQILHYSD